jgi:hypothetical protein
MKTYTELVDEYDLTFFTVFQKMTASDFNQMKADWLSMRRTALSKLNSQLNEQGKPGQLLNMDVSDEELCPYLLNPKQQFLFTKYSRILDFNVGFRPKNFVLIKKLSE